MKQVSQVFYKLISAHVKYCISVIGTWGALNCFHYFYIFLKFSIIVKGKKI
jgi:hypothetical protein